MQGSAGAAVYSFPQAWNWQMMLSKVFRSSRPGMSAWHAERGAQRAPGGADQCGARGDERDAKVVVHVQAALEQHDGQRARKHDQRAAQHLEHRRIPAPGSTQNLKLQVRPTLPSTLAISHRARMLLQSPVYAPRGPFGTASAGLVMGSAASRAPCMRKQPLWGGEASADAIMLADTEGI